MLTRLSPFGLPGRRCGSFAGRAPANVAPTAKVFVRSRFSRVYAPSRFGPVNVPARFSPVYAGSRYDVE
jgi:hypothetical protein